jgi:hypothetical protein
MDQTIDQNPYLIDDYLEFISKPDSYGGSLEILGASRKYHCGFAIHSINGIHVISAINVHVDRFNLHHLAFENYGDRKNHYNAIKYLKSREQINEESFSHYFTKDIEI